MLELDQREHQLLRRQLDGRPVLPGDPPQPPGNHQMDDEKEIAVESQHKALADPLDGSNRQPRHGIDRRFDRAQDKRTPNHDSLDTTTCDVSHKRVHVDNQIGKFRHLTLRRVSGRGIPCAIHGSITPLARAFP